MLWPTINKFAFALLYLHVSGSESAEQKRGTHQVRSRQLQNSGPQPVIYDTDYGPFVDDVFSLGLLANSGDLIDLQYVITTSENPALSAECVGKHLRSADYGNVPVGIGAELPPFGQRAGICDREGFLGFSLEEKCREGVDVSVDEDGISSVASLLEGSDRDDWWYIVVGGQTSLKKLVDDYPDAADKISTLIIMGGNWCSGFDPYPDVAAPTDETNISCDPAAANFILDKSSTNFEKVYYVPVVVADAIAGKDYIKIVEAGDSGADVGAAATIDFYKAWSAAARMDPDILVHAEAMQYDPETESTPQFDACAVMLALELLQDDSCEDRMSLYTFNSGVHFSERGDPGLFEFPDTPRAGFSYVAEQQGNDISALPDQCPYLTDITFDPSETPEDEMPVTVALGYKSAEAKASFYTEMAERMAGTFGGTNNTNSPKCFTTNEPEGGDDSIDPEEVGDDSIDPEEVSDDTTANEPEGSKTSKAKKARKKNKKSKKAKKAWEYSN